MNSSTGIGNTSEIMREARHGVIRKCGGKKRRRFSKWDMIDGRDCKPKEENTNVMQRA